MMNRLLLVRFLMMALSVAGWSGAAWAAPALACLPVSAPPDQVWIPPGAFIMGSDHDYPEEAPPHPVRVEGFWMDRHEVSNAQFAAFVAATGYRTLAERGLSPEQYPGLPPEMYRPGSMVFVPPDNLAVSAMQWWTFVPGAQWRHPQGPGSTIAGRESYPVVQIAREDAEAYARWAGRRLPSEAEFEYAARAGSAEDFPWGRQLHVGDQAMANTWEGAFPFRENGKDGHAGLAPVGCYPANAYGLYDMIGNVWEWVSDAWTPHHGARPAYPALDLEDALATRARTGEMGTIKGGSFLCSPNWCKRYRPSARHAQDLTVGTNHIGFRTVAKDTTP